MSNLVSLCMIVKNEEKNLSRCLESIKDIVDEIIIVDTGSTDKTVEIAKSYNARVYYYEWKNNFSSARNESLKYATGDWILIMDADDELCREDKDNFNTLIKGQLRSNVVYYFETLNYYGTTPNSNNISINLNPRLFKNNYGFNYEGEVHNQLVNHEHEFTGETCPIRIYHYGYLDTNIITKDKRKRNIELLENQIKKEPNKKYAYFNLGNEYFALDDKEKALENYYKAYQDFDPLTGYGFTLIGRIVISNYVLKNYEKALEFVKIGLRHYPKFTDLYFLKALVHKAEDKPTLQIKALEKCIELGEPPSTLKFLYGTGGFRAFYELGLAYMSLKDYETAYNCLVETIRLKPDYITPLYNITHILKLKKAPMDEIKGKVEEFFNDFPKAYPIIADIMYQEGLYEAALGYLGKYEKQSKLSENLKMFKAKCLMRTTSINQCLEYIDTIGEDSKFYIQILMYKVLYFSIIGKYDIALEIFSKLKENDLSEADHKLVQVYKQMLNLFTNTETSVLSEDENEKSYTPIIFDICEILLINNEFDKFEKSLELLNTISDKSILLQLGKLYYKHGYINMAIQEIKRSIKIFDVIDLEGLDILKIGC